MGSDVDRLAVSEGHSLEGQGFLEFIDNRPGLELLEETHCGIEQKETAYDSEVNPILKAGGKNCGGLYIRE